MTHFGASGEGDFIDLFMTGKGLARIPESGDDIDHSIGESCFREQACEV